MERADMGSGGVSWLDLGGVGLHGGILELGTSCEVRPVGGNSCLVHDMVTTHGRYLL